MHFSFPGGSSAFNRFRVIEVKGYSMGLRKSCIVVLGVCLLIVLGTGLQAQTVFFEDFSSASGTTPPTGWSSVVGVTTGATAQWRYDNPQGNPIASPIIAPFAICDSDFAGGGSTTNSTLFSPPFDASTQTQIKLEFDQYFRDLGASTILVEAFDGAVWNLVYSHTGSPAGSPTLPDSQSFDITALAAGATNAQLRFNYTAGFDWHWMVDNVHVFEPALIDVTVLSIDNPIFDPEDCNPILNPTETVSVSLQTNGSLPIGPGNVIQVEAYIDNVLVQTDFLITAQQYVQGDVIPFTFALPVATGSPGANVLSVKVVLTGDQEPGNDSMSVLIHQPVQDVGYTENFDTPPFNTGVGFPNNFSVPSFWLNDPNDGASVAGNAIQGWAPRNSPTGSGPANDHTSGSGGFMYLEDSASQPGDVALMSPCLNILSAASLPTVTFWFYSAASPGAANENVLTIDIIDEDLGGMDILGFATISGNGNNEWTRVSLDLSTIFASKARIVFRANNDNGTDSNDLAIDDFSFVNRLPTLGQAPQPGLSVLEINNAQNINGDPLAFGLNGPYFTTVTEGDILTFAMSGEPLQPIILFAGALNPNVANFPGVGQIDVGGPINMGSGLPTSIFVLADGTVLGGFNSFFVLAANGEANIGFSVPNLPIGVLSTFQCAMFTMTGSGLALSNCVEVTVQ